MTPKSAGAGLDAWGSTLLGEVSQVVDCKHVTAKFVSSGYPVVSIGELGNRYVCLRSAPRTTEHYYRILTEGSRRLRPGDLIMSRNATVGRVARVKYDHPPFGMGQDVVLIRPRGSALRVSFLQQLIKSPVVGRQFGEMMAGSTFKRVNVQEIKRLQVPIPPVDEQAAITDALDAADDLIAALERLIAKKQAIKQGIIQQLLTGKTRLPGFGGEWVPVKLRDAGATYGGLAGKVKADFGVGPASFVTFVEVMDGARLVGRRLERVDVRPGERQNRVQRGDILFNGSSETPEEVALAAVVEFDPSPTTYLNSFCFGYRLKDLRLIDPTYLAYFFRSAGGRELISSLAQGATRYNIAKTKLLELSPTLPPVAEQQAIVEVLRDCEIELALLRERIEKARSIKTGMMQELLTGRTRLPVEEGTA